MSPTDGIVVVDKPSGMTSHDVVARIRRVAGMRKVGHAGTLDPMATGVLVVGLGRATRLLGHLAANDKRYLATVRLGQSTVTDDAQGEATGGSSAARVTADDVVQGVEPLTGTIQQVPSAVSAVKVDGRRAYERVRSGEDVVLPARQVVVSALKVLDLRRPTADLLDVDLDVTCSSGTYVRALARDLGSGLGTGGHLTALRRTRVGGFTIDQARPLADLETSFTCLSLDDAVGAAFPRRHVDADDAEAVRHGRPIASAGETSPTGVFDADGRVLALMAPKGDHLAVLVGLVG
ncbi:MAG: tRNA pseudouridine(55) synthase TruB [Actinomycetes bacterium]